MNQAEVFGDASLEEALLTALADRRYNCQAWAAMGCTALGFRSAVPGLLLLLDHPQWICRQEAVKGLGWLGDETVVPALVPVLGDPTAGLPQEAAAALARIGGDAALTALWHEFQHRRSPRIGHVASALALFGDEVLPRLIETATDPDPNQRYWAAVALGSTGNEAAVPTLERLVATDTGRTVFDGVVGVAAKKALRTLRRIQASIAAREA